LINNPSHDVALERVINVPARGIGATTVQRLRQVANRERIPILDAARKAGLIETIPKRSAVKVASFVAMYDSLCVKATATIEDLVLYLIEETGYREYLNQTGDDDQDNDRSANVDEFINAAVEYDRQHPEDGSLEEFLEQIALVSSTDQWEDNNDRVTVMTLHAAKGLEFPRVYIIGVEDDLLPHARSKESEEQIEEERRLLFVGITRARERLQLSYCQSRSIHGQARPVIPSPFLLELPREDMRQVDAAPEADFFDDSPYPDSWDIPDDDDDDEMCQLVEEERAAIRRSKPAPPVAIPQIKTAAQMAGATPSLAGQLKTGMVVEHPRHGEGTVVSLSGRGPKCTATIQFEDGETKSFRVAFADLRVVN